MGVARSMDKAHYGTRRTSESIQGSGSYEQQSLLFDALPKYISLGQGNEAGKNTPLQLFIATIIHLITMKLKWFNLKVPTKLLANLLFSKRVAREAFLGIRGSGFLVGEDIDKMFNLHRIQARTSRIYK